MAPARSDELNVQVPGSALIFLQNFGCFENAGQKQLKIHKFYYFL